MKVRPSGALANFSAAGAAAGGAVRAGARGGTRYQSLERNTKHVEMIDRKLDGLACS